MAPTRTRTRQCARLALLATVVGGSAGCLSIGTLQTASTLGKGNFQISAEPGIYGAAVVKPGGGGTVSEALPHFDVAFRYGVTDWFDLGIRSGWSLIELQSKFLFTAPDAQRLAISTAPTLGATIKNGDTSNSTLTTVNLAVPVLFGIKHFRANEFVFGLRFNNLIFAYADSNGSVGIYEWGVGGTIGYAFALGETFKIFPELAVSVPVVVTGGVTGRNVAGLAGFGVATWQLKVGLMFGRTTARAPVELQPVPPPAPEADPELAPFPAPPPVPAPVPGDPLPPPAPVDPPPPPPAPPL